MSWKMPLFEGQLLIRKFHRRRFPPENTLRKVNNEVRIGTFINKIIEMTMSSHHIPQDE